VHIVEKFFFLTCHSFWIRSARIRILNNFFDPAKGFGSDPDRQYCAFVYFFYSVQKVFFSQHCLPLKFLWGFRSWHCYRYRVLTCYLLLVTCGVVSSPPRRRVEGTSVRRSGRPSRCCCSVVVSPPGKRVANTSV
jgi:hypothetical protein